MHDFLNNITITYSKLHPSTIICHYFIYIRIRTQLCIISFYFTSMHTLNKTFKLVLSFIWMTFLLIYEATFQYKFFFTKKLFFKKFKNQ